MKKTQLPLAFTLLVICLTIIIITPSIGQNIKPGYIQSKMLVRIMNGHQAKRGMIDDDMPTRVIEYNDSSRRDTAIYSILSYEQFGRVKEENDIYYKGQIYEHHFIITYQNQGGDSIIVTYHELKENKTSTFKPLEVDTQVNDIHGYLKKYVYYNFDGTTYLLGGGSEVKSSYFPDRKVSSRETFSYNTVNGLLEPSQKTMYYLGSNGEYDSALLYQYDNVANNYVFNYRLTDIKYNNDRTDLPESLTAMNIVNGIYSPLFKITGSYTEIGQRETFKVENYDGSSFYTTSIVTSTFDRFSNITSQIERKYTAAGPNDSTRVFIHYGYDKKDRVISANYRQFSIKSGFIPYAIDYFYDVVSIIEKKRNHIQVYPMPINDVLNINLGTVSGSAHIVITDLAGRRYKIFQIQLIAAQTIQLDISAIPSGSYLLNAVVNGNNYSSKLIKQ